MAAPEVCIERLASFGWNGGFFVTGTHGIEVDVVDEVPGVCVGFDEVRFVPTLEKVAKTFMFAIVANGVGGLEPAEGLAEVSPGCLYDKVVVVGHKTVAVENNSIPHEHGLEGFEEKLAVGVGEEDFFAFIATGCHVVAGPVKLDPYGPCHGWGSYRYQAMMSSVKR